jgi:hypothetical protein
MEVATLVVPAPRVGSTGPTRAMVLRTASGTAGFAWTVTLRSRTVGPTLAMEVIAGRRRTMVPGRSALAVAWAAAGTPWSVSRVGVCYTGTNTQCCCAKSTGDGCSCGKLLEFHVPHLLCRELVGHSPPDYPKVRKVIYELAVSAYGYGLS